LVNLGIRAEDRREDKLETSYRYVLVDECQDMSVGQMKLLQALKRDDSVYFLVGDDWQSINRFAGSDVAFLRNCGDYPGHVQTGTLSTTFRFGEGILGPSTEFVLSNPEQRKRTVTSASVTVDRVSPSFTLTIPPPVSNAPRRVFRHLHEAFVKSGPPIRS